MDESRMRATDHLGKKQRGLTKTSEPALLQCFFRSGRQDLNLRPLGPKPTLDGLQGFPRVFLSFAIIAFSVRIRQIVYMGLYLIFSCDSKMRAKPGFFQNA